MQKRNASWDAPPASGDPTTPPNRLPRNLLLVALVSLLTDASTEMIFPLLPALLTTLGGGALLFGVMEGAAESVSSFLKYYAGRWSDRLGNRKHFTIAGYGFSALMKLGFPWAALPWHVVALRSLDRVGKGIRNAPRDALISESVPRRRWGFAFGFHRAFDTVGAFLGPLLALALVGAFTLRQVFLVAALPALVGVGLLFFLREPRHLTREKTPRDRLPHDATLSSYLLLIAVFTLGNLSVGFLLLLGVQGGLSAPHVLLIYLAYNAVYALFAFPLGALTDRVGRLPLLALAFTGVILGALMVARDPPTAWMGFLPAAIAFGFASASFEGNGRAVAADLAPSGARGTVLGAYHATIGFAALPGGLLAGLLWGFDPRLTFLVAALLAATALAELLWLGFGDLGRRTGGWTGSHRGHEDPR